VYLLELWCPTKISASLRVWTIRELKSCRRYNAWHITCTYSFTDDALWKSEFSSPCHHCQKLCTCVKKQGGHFNHLPVLSVCLASVNTTDSFLDTDLWEEDSVTQPGVSVAINYRHGTLGKTQVRRETVLNFTAKTCNCRWFWRLHGKSNKNSSKYQNHNSSKCTY